MIKEERDFVWISDIIRKAREKIERLSLKSVHFWLPFLSFLSLKWIFLGKKHSKRGEFKLTKLNISHILHNSNLPQLKNQRHNPIKFIIAGPSPTNAFLRFCWLHASRSGCENVVDHSLDRVRWRKRVRIWRGTERRGECNKKCIFLKSILLLVLHKTSRKERKGVFITARYFSSILSSYFKIM